MGRPVKSESRMTSLANINRRDQELPSDQPFDQIETMRGNTQKWLNPETM
jgi:hypothetical protein